MTSRLDVIELGTQAYRTVVVAHKDVVDLVAVARAAHAYLAAAQHGLNDSTDDNKLGEALRPLLAEETT